MHRNGKRLNILINQLLDLSRLESGGLQLKMQAGDLVTYVRSLVFSFAAKAEREHKSLHFETAIATLDMYFDPDKLEKIIFNLLSNAFKFTAAPGRILVTLDQDEHSAIIKVSDTGKGISKTELPHIFDRFYQADNSSTRRREGAGIGLALTKELVELHNGSIEVESKAELGSTFTIKLKKVNASPNKEEVTDEYSWEFEIHDRSSRQESLPETNGLQSLSIEQYGSDSPAKILIVEDNEDVREYIKMHLSQHELLEAENGEEGLKKAINYQPDLVISDIMMPQLDGLTLCKLIKTDQRTRDIPVHTAHSKSCGRKQNRRTGDGSR